MVFSDIKVRDGGVDIYPIYPFLYRVSYHYSSLDILFKLFSLISRNFLLLKFWIYLSIPLVFLWYLSETDDLTVSIVTTLQGVSKVLA